MSENLWPDFAELPKIKTPKEILDEQSGFLSERTNGLIYADVIELDPTLYTLFGDGEQFDFEFKLVIKCKTLDKYKFDVFSVFHNIDLYPNYLKLDPEIKTELQVPTKYYKAQSEDEFYFNLQQVFSTLRLRTVIGSLMRLAK